MISILQVVLLVRSWRYQQGRLTNVQLLYLMGFRHRVSISQHGSEVVDLHAVAGLVRRGCESGAIPEPAHCDWMLKSKLMLYSHFGKFRAP